MKHTNRIEIGLERRFEALRRLAQDKTILLVAQFIRNCNRIRIPCGALRTRSVRPPRPNRTLSTGESKLELINAIFINLNT